MYGIDWREAFFYETKEKGILFLAVSVVKYNKHSHALNTFDILRGKFFLAEVLMEWNF